MDEIAARAGVSRGAVSLAMRRSSKISVKTTETILRVAKELGYRPNLNASRLARSDFSTFGVVVSNLHNPIIAEIIDSIFLSSPAGEFDTYLGTGFNIVERERAAIDSFLSHRVKGMVLIGSLLSEQEILDIAKIVPTVVVGRRIQGLDCVLVDDAVGGRMVAEHLAGLGHKHFAHIDGGTGAGATLRKSAFADYLKRTLGITPEIVPGDYSQESGYRGAMTLLDSRQRPSAIFAANDLMALGVMGAARTLGLSAGADFALVGFDNISLSAYDFVSLTTVSYSRHNMGRTARELLLARCEEIDRPANTIDLPPNLIIRKSSSCDLKKTPLEQ